MTATVLCDTATIGTNAFSGVATVKCNIGSTAAEAYINDENVDVVFLGNVVANIGNTGYDTLSAAIEAAQSGETVVLNVSGTFADLIGTGYSVSNRYMIKTDNITIDLNGNTITDVPNFTFELSGNNITFKNGKLVGATSTAKASGYISYVLSVNGKGNHITGVILDSIEATGGISVADAEATLKNVTGHGADYYAVCTQVGGKAIIESGTYDRLTPTEGKSYSSKTLLWAEGAVTNGEANDACTECGTTYGASEIIIKGGNFKVYADGALHNTGANDIAPVIQGGTYNVDVQSLGYLTEGYGQNDNGDGTYTVVASVASINGKLYSNLAAAIEAAQTGETVTLNKSGTFNELFGADENGHYYGEYNPYLIMTDGITIDLGGNTISDMPNDTLTIKADNVTLKNGKLEAATSTTSNSGYESYALAVIKKDSSTVLTGVVIENIETLGGIDVDGAEVTLIDVTAHGTNYYAVCSQGGSDVTIKSGTYDKITLADGKSYVSNALFWISSSTDTGVSELTIENGTFTVADGGSLYNESGAVPVIKGGTYNVDVKDYLTAAYTETVNTEVGTYTVVYNGLLGDADGNGSITGADATSILRHAANLETLTGANLTNADVNGDGSVTGADATLVLRYVAGLDETLGASSGATEEEATK